MDKVKLQYYKEQLLQKRHRLEKQIKSIEEGGLNISMKDSIGELSLYDNHPADIGNELFERGKDIALRDNALIQLGHIGDALARIEEGTYGLCSSCHRPIGEERLEAMPEAIQCLYCRREFEGNGNRHPRPIEEDVIRPPFGDQSDDGDLQFDGEDAWQEVARYGTSETPSDLGEERAEYPNVYINWDEDRNEVEDVESFPYIIEKDGLIAKDYSKGDSSKPKAW